MAPSGCNRTFQAKMRTRKLVQKGTMTSRSRICRHLPLDRAITYPTGVAMRMQNTVVRMLR